MAPSDETTTPEATAEAPTVQTLAAEAYGWFETARRDENDEDSGFVRLKDDRPEWIADLVHDAHGRDFLPDDWRYDKIRDALEAIADSDDPEDETRFEFADAGADVYTGRGLAWLASNLNRTGYCDEWLSEYGSTGYTDGEYGRGGGERITLAAIVAGGQYLEADEIYGLVLDFLTTRAEQVPA